MGDENKSYFMMIFKFIFKIITIPFILLFKLFELFPKNPRIIAFVLGIIAIFGTIYYFYINEEDDDSEETEETEESGNVTPPVSGGGGTTGSGGGASSPQNATCSSVPAEGEGGCPTGYIKKTDSDSIQCSSTTCDVSEDADLNTCCEPEPEPAAVNCVGNWSEWSNCSAECGEGTQNRTYNITTQPQYGGTPCPTSQGSQDSQPCNTQACAICSSFRCPDDYNPRSEAVNESCGKTQCDNSNIDLCCETIQGGDDSAGDGDTGVVENATCSTVRCPRGYYYKAYLADTACAGRTCDVEIGGVDLNTCCLKFNCTDPFAQGNPPVGYVADENVEAGVTFSAGSVAGVRCDTENGYYVPYSNIITATCGDDIDGNPPNYILSGCEQGCSAPDTIPTGYAGSLPAALPVGNSRIPGSIVQCDDNYSGTPQYNCNTAGQAYTLSGCDPDQCTRPTDTTYTTGYTNLPANLPVVSGFGTISGASCASNYHSLSDGIQYTCSTRGEEYTLGGCSPDQCTEPDTTGYNITGVTNLERRNFSVDVTCAPGYGSGTSATAQAVACDGHRENYTLTGCGDKTGFCSGNTSVSDFTCGDGYTLKSDSADRIGRDTESCCDPWTCVFQDVNISSYNINGAIRGNGETIPYTDIGSATVECADDAQSTGDISIQPCDSNNGNVILSGCGPAPVTAPVTAQVSESGDTGDSEERSEEPEPEGDNNYWYIAKTGSDRVDFDGQRNCTSVCINYGKECDRDYWGNELNEIISGRSDIPWADEIPQTIKEVACNGAPSVTATHYSPFVELGASATRCSYNVSGDLVSGNINTCAEPPPSGKARICKCV